MDIGISTYAFYWHLSERVKRPWEIQDVLQETAAVGAKVLQVCDYAPLDGMGGPQLAAIRTMASDLDIDLELGTKGVHPDHLARYLDIAEALDAKLLRTMLVVPSHTPSIVEAKDILANVLPRLERQGVQLALETYEQVPTAELVQLVSTFDNPHIGICSDPANTVAILENPKEVIDLTAPHVVNMHIKDFAFSRTEGSIGFTLSGVPLGEGLLPYDYMIEAIRPVERGINQIIEHWLSWQGSEDATLREELEWTRHSYNFLAGR